MTPQTFLEKFPDFSNLPTEQTEAQIEESELLLNADLLGDKYETALLYHIAHELTLSSFTSIPRQIVSRSIERGSITYATIQNDLETIYYNSTKHGQKFLLIFNANKTPFAMAICD